MSDLEPCPFCGGEAEILHLYEGAKPYVSCTECDAWLESKECAVTAWNMRPIEEELRDEVSQLINGADY